MTTPDEHRRRAEARKNELLAAVDADRENASRYLTPGLAAADRISLPGDDHASPRAVYTFLPLAEAINPSKGGLFTHYAESWWIIHPDKGLAFYHAPGRPHGRGSPQCNTSEQITRMIHAKMSPPGTEVRYIKSAWVPASPDDY